MGDVPQRVLVVDDEERMRKLLVLHLRRAFEVDTAASGRDALQMVTERRYHLVVLDILMPDMDGWEVCRRLRRRHGVPVLMLTALTDVEDKLEAFEAGADDYLTKPFDPRELVARAEALVRRGGFAATESGGERTPLVSSGITVDPAARSVDVDGAQVVLTPKEFDLLSYLVQHAGEAFTREELLQEVWGDAGFVETRTVDSHIKTLREKLGRQGAGKALVTVWGVGYKFEPSARST